ncbi:hypothetical protein EB796_000190 [Bugula neritina]|uniref:Uncharacterized protein n=1 Tax=Bugula neritina TaxID=10212 RepID=A0A7J7KTI5_BUGNE|nr:hypothetical protein EB796_000190 [Bugula neritina]
MQCLFDGLSLPKLQSLNLCDVSLVNGIEMDLSMLVENLEELDISWLKNCSDSAFNCILTSLLGSTGEKLKVLHCSGTAIVMSQLRALLRNFPNLETLNIESCRQLPRGIKRKYEGKFEVTALRKKCALSA